MASMLLSTAASSVAAANPLAAIGLQLAASTLGNAVDNAIFGGPKDTHREGARLKDLAVQTSTYGEMIPIVYGSARLAGNIIWSRPIKEIATTTTSTQGGKGGGGPSSSSTEFSYFISLAIAVCEGEIDEVLRIWADADLLDLSEGTYRIYKGGEDQLPDPLIESYEGVGSTPAYRGMAYIVVEDFPLGAYGNRIPNFTAEVKRKILWPDVDGQSVENMVKDMIMIPGSGEFVYDTTIQEKIEGEDVGGNFVQSGDKSIINRHTPEETANALVALDQLEDSCPNVEWIGVVVNWFGDNMDAGLCTIKPGVEFTASQATTSPEVWSVGSFDRSTAWQITYDSGLPRYGGTPDDQSLLRYLDELKARGYNIFFYPMFLMDVTDKPWRGRVTGSTTDVANFFTKTDGYNAFINHYASLVKDKVDAFAIGSELIGLTKVNDGASTNRNFPAVDALVSLATTVKTTMGSGVKVTYAADWSEYHHTDEGWYNLDPLWASSNIDFIGIDAYFPLTDVPQNELGYDIPTIKQGWTSGEGYDWYYSDPERTTKVNLEAKYAWKNLDWFWKNSHVNPDTNSTAWTPQSKKIWFTEFGFPSVDGATNQPNVFYDPTSSESFFPYHSKGRIDFRAQRAGIAATLSEWDGSDMIEHLFLWTWDARPYPYWPDMLSVWADGGVWKTGHWVQGKFGLSSLAAIVADLSERAGLPQSFIDVTRLDDQVEGFVVSSQNSARRLIEQLMAAYFFDAAESDGLLKFIPRGNASVLNIAEDQLIPLTSAQTGEAIEITRTQELELPQRVEILYINRLKNYQTGTQHAQRLTASAVDVQSLSLPIVMSDQKAKIIADVALYNSWMSRLRYQFHIPTQYAGLEPADVITVSANNASHVMRVTHVQFGRPGMLRIQAVAEDVSTYDFYAPPGESTVVRTPKAPVPSTLYRLLDMPALSTDSADEALLRMAAIGETTDGWKGAVIYRSDDEGGSYESLASFVQPATLGTVTTALADGPTSVFDDQNTLDVVLMGEGTLASATELAVLNGANAALVGDEVIQFKSAVELNPNKYRLSGLLRGRQGTEWATGGHSAGEAFTLLDNHLQKEAMADGLIGLSRLYKGVSVGKTLGSVSAQSFTYQARALKPYSPVHVTGERDGSDNLSISWVRRTRIGGQWRDLTDVPLSEESEAYEIDILDGSDVMRTIAANNSGATYSAADQVNDFGAAQSSINITVYQLSGRVGRGYGTSATV